MRKQKTSSHSKYNYLQYFILLSLAAIATTTVVCVNESIGAWLLIKSYDNDLAYS